MDNQECRLFNLVDSIGETENNVFKIVYTDEESETDDVKVKGYTVFYKEMKNFYIEIIRFSEELFNSVFEYKLYQYLNDTEIEFEADYLIKELEKFYE